MVPLVDPGGTTRAGVGAEPSALAGTSALTLATLVALTTAGVALALLAASAREEAGDEAQPSAATTAANRTTADAIAPTFA